MATNKKSAITALWTRSTYIEDNYPSVAKAIRNSGKTPYDVIQKKYPALISEFAKAGSRLSGCGEPSLSGGAPSGYTNVTESKTIKLLQGLADKRYSQEELKDIINSYWQVITEQVAGGKNVQIFSVGSFRASSKNGRPLVKFSMSDAFKKQVAEIVDEKNTKLPAYVPGKKPKFSK